MPSVLFVCVANSFRSQMAEAMAKASAGPGWEIWSAGSAPGGGVHPLAIQLMDELKLDLRGQRSKGLDAVPARTWDYVVTMGCGDSCPAVPARRRLDWDLPDPAALALEEARRLRDDLQARVRELLSAHRPS
jgi:protein-tyrosine-phosphatase